MKQTTIVAVVLGVLILISAVQTVQLYNLKTTISGGGLKTASASTPVAASGDVGTVPDSIKNLPAMVGGC